ncbi:hypothetical protein SAMN05421542_0447 [Chryseobacterium jejuense]|uniref:Uncharacterized protein n=1 Tax=Chryseobacterium jejuense TaxID=445960 RepID=A0A2X2X135_CHRJE|nr:hypothetical protein SAMN05421542_0447 [Chryseobacterium jejuense]SQB46716.1 Uncharacterised protein [Chryseobacterium jejuense]
MSNEAPAKKITSSNRFIDSFFAHLKLKHYENQTLRLRKTLITLQSKFHVLKYPQSSVYI